MPATRGVSLVSGDPWQWAVTVSIFKNALVLKQLGIAVGMPLALVALVIVLTSGNGVYALYALGLILALLFFTWLFVMAVYQGRYDVEFVLDDKGVLCRTQAKQAKTNRFVNTLTVVLGLLSGKPAAAGAAVLAQSRQEVYLAWNRVRRVSPKPQSLTILLRGGWTENIALFCTKENYAQIEQLVKLRTKH